MINEYTIRSYIRQAYKISTDIKSVIDQVFYWTIKANCRQAPMITRPEAIIASFRRRQVSSFTFKFNPVSIMHYTIRMKNYTCHLIKENSGSYAYINFRRKGGFYIFDMDIEDIAEVMIAYDDYFPLIYEEFDMCRNKDLKRALLLDLNVATARGIIAELEKEGIIKIPYDYVIRGQAEGRVTISYNSGQNTISSPLDHLRARLIRRFSRRSKTQKQNKNTIL